MLICLVLLYGTTPLYFHAFLSSVDFFHNQLFRKNLLGIPSDFKQFGSRSGSKYKLFTKVISRRHKEVKSKVPRTYTNY